MLLSNRHHDVTTGYSLRTTFLCGILILGGYSVLYHFTGYQQLLLLTRAKLSRIRLVDVASTLTPTNAAQLEKCPETPSGLGKITRIQH